MARIEDISVVPCQSFSKSKLVLPDDMFTDNPVFVDTSKEFNDDCGDSCKI